MNIRELEIKNFQSHRDTRIKFSRGFNCIVGPTRSGKSAIFRALDFLFFNKWVPENVRFGEAECSIKAIFDTFTIIRTKGTGINKVELIPSGGTSMIYENFGNSYPDDIKAYLKLSEISIDDKKSLPLNTSDQDTPLFILYESGLFKSKLFGNISKTQIVDSILFHLSKDKREMQFRNNVLDGLIESIKNKLINIKDLLGHKELIKTIGEILEKLKKVQRKRDEVVRVRGRFNSYKDAVLKYKSKVDVLNSVDVPKMEKILKCDTLLNTLVQHQKKVHTIDGRLNSLSNDESSLQKKEDSINTEMSNIKVCPTCGSSLS